MSGSLANDPSWKAREQSEEASYARGKEEAQLAALRDKLRDENRSAAETPPEKAIVSQLPSGDIEGGFGGQENLEDRYATTSGEH